MMRAPCCLPRSFPMLLVVAFVAMQTAATAHEYEHVLHEHDAPCGQHVLADQLAKAPAPTPFVIVVPRAAGYGARPLLFSVARPLPDRIARAPPLIPGLG